MENAKLNILFKEKRPYLNRIAARFTTDEDEKEDLIQETIYRSLSSIEKFIQHPKLMSWLFTIMKNTYINNYRKTKRFETMQQNFLVSDQPKHAKNRGESQFVNADINSALKELSNDNYLIFTMFLEGYKYHEIAQHFNIPEGTVKTRIHVSRKFLQKRLSTYANFN
ncbi:RNA polymerase sigma factor [Sphingobacterium sp. Mn56C]|uniref:RNA polymerase sigma factor n=1 Tax=Sphingobacterium sp. Mn56C TaxID=3395261 RepID=UPI003BE78881